MAQRSFGDLALGVDIGGTFTDLVALDRKTGWMATEKVLTSVDDHARAILTGIEKLMARHGFAGRDVRTTIHGTTLATNALIERRGAQTALIVTRGFRDLLEMGREWRFDIFDLSIDIPPPLVPRSRVYEVTERLDKDGAVVEPLAEAEVRAIGRRLRDAGIQSVAVCLLHAYRDPVHERAIAAILREEDPELAVSLSSEVIPDIREYERANTTVANAYVRPIIQNYLLRFQEQLRAVAERSSLLIMTSEGGTMSAEAIATFPIRLIESGPAGGVLAATHVGRSAKLPKIIAFDMGGTTAKISLVENGEPTRATEFEVGRMHRFAKGSGLPLKIPVLHMIEIGAGGGSIARGDEMGLLKVGPESAGASPGPACYGLGGTKPTVTDADLALGYLDAGYFLGGEMQLERKRAEEAIAAELAGPLGISVTRAAWGVHEVVNDSMARAMRIHCLEQGQDPREYTLVAFGGAGPVHAFRVAQAVGIKHAVFPSAAGVMSAFGFLVARPSIELVRAYLAPLSEVNAAHVDALYKGMENEARAMLRSAGVRPSGIELKREVAVRFSGQSYELIVPVRSGKMGRPHLDEVARAFAREYLARYRRVTSDVPVEAVTWRLTLSGPRPAMHAARASGRTLQAARKGTRPAYFPEKGGFVKTPVYDRYALGPGLRFTGPAIVEERESTAVIGPGGTVTVGRDGNLNVEIR